jgi:hypothetical protein
VVSFRVPKSSTRIFAILARGAPVGVILRRGPSKQVLLIKWYLGSDRLELGQWFKGRIYERRCDLSPSGELFLYFAGKHRGPFGTWTAISKPPYLTALALWPKGDAWGGGGVFESELAIALNHRPGEDVLADGFRLKKRMRVGLFGDRSGWGEDFPIQDALLARRGWTLVDRGQGTRQAAHAPVRWLFTRPLIYERSSKQGHRLQMQIKGFIRKNDAHYWIDYVVRDDDGAALVDLPNTDWADWDGQGDLLYARDGKLFRLARKHVGSNSAAPKLIADLSDLAFEPKPAPREATSW